MVRGIYNKIDNALMYGANKAVKAWNWTTGGTKADLANCVLGLGALSGGCVHLGCLVVAPLIGGLAFSNARSEKEEVEALESDSLSYVAEGNKYFDKIFGPIAGIFSLVNMGASLSDPDFDQRSRGLAAALISGAFAASTYITRADYLPPQKNCLSRGLDKLDDIIANYKLKPELIPVRR